MKTEFKAKFLQHLNQKKQDEGFTLIELLVVIIIIGILVAVALPNYLSNTAKAKQSGAKQAIGYVNRAQTAYRIDNSSFASSFGALAIGTLGNNTTNSSTYYSYQIDGGISTATIIATSLDGALKAYSGATTMYPDANNQPEMTSVICEANSSGTAPAIPPDTSGGTAPPVCPSTYTDLSSK